MLRGVSVVFQSAFLSLHAALFEHSSVSWFVTVYTVEELLATNVTFGKHWYGLKPEKCILICICMYILARVAEQWYWNTAYGIDFTKHFDIVLNSFHLTRSTCYSNTCISKLFVAHRRTFYEDALDARWAFDVLQVHIGLLQTRRFGCITLWSLYSIKRNIC